jgi:hypothetical protein
MNQFVPMLYDPVADRVILLGGNTGYGFAFAIDLRSPLGPYPLDQHCCGWDEFTPADRYVPGAIYDPVRDALVVVGGRKRVCPANARDLWTLVRGTPLRQNNIEPADVAEGGGGGDGRGAVRGSDLRVTRVSAAVGARGVLVSLAPAAAGDARIDLVDVGGRLVATRRASWTTAGPHAITVGDEAALAPGVYFICVRQAGLVAVAKTVVLE